MCQINTDPMVHRSGYVQVVVPRTIVHTGQPRDMVVRNRVDRGKQNCDVVSKKYCPWRKN